MNEEKDYRVYLKRPDGSEYSVVVYDCRSDNEAKDFCLFYCGEVGDDDVVVRVEEEE